MLIIKYKTFDGLNKCLIGHRRDRLHVWMNVEEIEIELWFERMFENSFLRLIWNF